MYFTGDDGNQNSLVYIPMFSSVILDSNKKFTQWISTEAASKEIKPFESNLEPNMYNLANSRATLKFNNSALVQKRSSSFWIDT